MPQQKTKSPKKTAKKAQAKRSAKLEWQPNKTFELELTIPQKKVKQTYQQVLENLAKTTEVKGFRKGKAPLNLVEKQLGKQHTYDQTIQQLVSDQYLEALKQHQLKPIVPPKISVVSMEEGKDWVVKAVACEAPKVKLGNWEKAVKGASAASKIWTPDKGEQPSKPEGQEEAKTATEQTELTQQQKLSKIFDALLKEAEVKVADRLVEEEVNRMLSRLLDQVNKLGLTIDQYLASQNTSSEKLREQYRQTAERTLKLEFILAQISQEKKLNASEEEIAKMIQAVPDDQEKEKLNTPEQKAYIASVLRKRKTIDYLLGL